MYILAKIICFLCIYILPKMMLKKPIKIKELVVFLILGLYTVPIIRQSVIDNPETFKTITSFHKINFNQYSELTLY